MKTQTVSAAMLAALVSGASATWTDASPFSTPANCDNECNAQQSSGFDWGSLATGSFSSYGDINFSGFTCANSFSKRSELMPRDFQSKCITGSASQDLSSAPSISCGDSSSVDAFSITTFQVSVEFDCDLEFHYTMGDGSTCKQTASCETGGTTVTNNQCGGAQSVSVIMPSPPEGKPDTCSIGFHSIGFDCSTASSTHSKSSTTISLTKSTAAATTTSKAVKTTSTAKAASSSVSSAAASSSTPAAAASSTTKVVVTSTSTSVIPVTSTHTANGTTSVVVSSSVSTVIVTSTSTICTKCQETSPTSPLAAASTTVAVGTTTQVVYTSITTCPVTNTHISAGTTHLETTSTVSTVLITSLTSAPVAASSTTPAGPVETAPCPSALPQCMNTWLFITECVDNTDCACYCPSTDFVNNVFECLSAYGASDSDIADAQSYFQGICAPYVPQNPAIVTGATTVTVTGVITPAPTVPVTTVSVLTTIVVPCTETTGVSAGSVIPSSFSSVVISTVFTVPQVAFTTVAGASAAGAALVAGTPAPTTAAAVHSTTLTSIHTSATKSSNATASASKTAVAFTGAAAPSSSIAMGSIVAALLFAVFTI